MNKIIVSSMALLKLLDGMIHNIQQHEWCPIVVRDDTFYIDGRVGEVNCKASGTFSSNPKSQSIIKLWTFLAILEEQPITLMFGDNDWIWIKEAIL